MSAASSIPPALITQGEWFMRICNACRYCEGYCAVFPALERRLDFAEADLNYLANLCHDCGSCFDACQYAPPHEFALNFPRALAEIRRETYAKYAWPRVLAHLFHANALAAGVIVAASLALFVAVTTAVSDPAILFSAHADSQGSFYAVISHDAMVLTFGAVSLFVLAAILMGLLHFFRDTGDDGRGVRHPATVGRALLAVARLSYLDGGGQGCIQPDEPPSLARRRFHHATFYGFLLCFAATSVAAIYHYALGRPAPYPPLSAPVLLGTAGGLGLLMGPAGQLWLKVRRHPSLLAPGQRSMDVVFLVLLFLTSLTGLLLLILRDTPAMGALLAVHLGLVLGFFLTIPYGKFVHAFYRFVALLRYEAERSQPVELTLD